MKEIITVSQLNDNIKFLLEETSLLVQSPCSGPRGTPKARLPVRKPCMIQGSCRIMIDRYVSMMTGLLKQFYYLIIPATGLDCGRSFPLSVKLKPSRTGGALVLFLGSFLVLFTLLLALVIWRHSDHTSTVHLVLNLLGALFLLALLVGGVFFFLLGLASFSNEAVWILDSERVSCRSRLLLKRETWSEPLRSYDSVLLVNLAAIGGGRPAFQIVLKHSVDEEKNVLLYASDSYQQFLRRGKELADMLNLPLTQAGGSSR